MLAGASCAVMSRADLGTLRSPLKEKIMTSADIKGCKSIVVISV